MAAVLSDLPQSVREIAEIIGREDALRLVGQLPTCYAGNDGKKSNRVIMYVPKRLAPDHKLVEILGWHVAMKLVRHFGGEILQPANFRKIYSRYRDEAILKILHAGARPSMVADLLGVSERHVRNLARENPQEEISRVSIKNPS